MPIEHICQYLLEKYFLKFYAGRKLGFFVGYLKQAVDIVSTGRAETKRWTLCPPRELKQKCGHRVHQGAKTKGGHRVHRRS